MDPRRTAFVVSSVVLSLAIAAPRARGQSLDYDLEGNTVNSTLGSSVANVGDLDGDGCDEFIVGAPDVWNGTNAGAAMICSGKTGATIDTLTGGVATLFGASVDGGFDIDGDGWSEVVVGAPWDSTKGMQSGRVVVYSPHLKTTLWDLDGSANSQFGYAVRGVADLDKDGADDFLVGAPLTDNVYVYSGSTGAPLYTLNGQAGGELGLAVSGGGEMNGDSHIDFLVAAPFRTDSNGVQVGRVSAFSGKDGTKLWSVDGSAASGLGGFGWSIAHPGDLDGDGRGDCVVGNPNDIDPTTSTPTGSVTVISGASGATLYTLYGSSSYEYFGLSVHGVGGDLDGDGTTDYLVGAPYLSSGGYAELFSAGGTPIYTYVQETVDPLGYQSHYGFAACGADVDGDGRPDVLIGSDDFENFHGLLEARTTEIASWSNFGAGWPGTLGMPTITAEENPVVGQPINIDISNSAGVTTPALLMIGVTQVSIPTSKGGTLLVSPIISILLSLPASGFTLSGNVPNDPAIYGFDAYLQVLESDHGASKGLSFTDGLDLHFGFD